MEGLVEEIVVGAVGSAGGDVARLADSWLLIVFWWRAVWGSTDKLLKGR